MPREIAVPAGIPATDPILATLKPLFAACVGASTSSVPAPVSVRGPVKLMKPIPAACLTRRSIADEPDKQAEGEQRTARTSTSAKLRPLALSRSIQTAPDTPPNASREDGLTLPRSYATAGTAFVSASEISGSRMVTRVPWDGRDSSNTLPPLSVTNLHAFGSPSPAPRPASRPLKNGSNARRAASNGMPRPSSATVISPLMVPSNERRAPFSTTRPPAATASSALTTTTRNASSICTRSTKTDSGLISYQQHRSRWLDIQCQY